MLQSCTLLSLGSSFFGLISSTTAAVTALHSFTMHLTCTYRECENQKTRIQMYIIVGSYAAQNIPMIYD